MRRASFKRRQTRKSRKSSKSTNIKSDASLMVIYIPSRHKEEWCNLLVKNKKKKKEKKDMKEKEIKTGESEKKFDEKAKLDDRS